MPARRGCRDSTGGSHGELDGFVSKGGKVVPDDTDPDGRTLLVFYPSIIPGETDYIRPAVRI